MYSKWFTVGVVGLWLASMGWLVSQKVIPPMLVGEPPSYRAMADAQIQSVPVGWQFLINGKPVGWAVTSAKHLPGGASELTGRVRVERLPLGDLMPGWIGQWLKLSNQGLDFVRLDAENTVIINEMGRLSRFQSEVKLQPFNETIEVRGRVEQNRLKVTARSGTFSYDTETYFHSDAVLGDSMSPQAQMPGLRLGQTWRVPCYNPMQPAHGPVEVLRATVESMEPFRWEKESETVWLVTFHSESGLIAQTNGRPMGRLWVRRDGTVLKQEARLLDSTLVFLRMPEAEAAQLIETHGKRHRPHWRGAVSPESARP